jgi:hypothetical protein
MLKLLYHIYLKNQEESTRKNPTLFGGIGFLFYVLYITSPEMVLVEQLLIHLVTLAERMDREPLELQLFQFD